MEDTENTGLDGRTVAGLGTLVAPKQMTLFVQRATKYSGKTQSPAPNLNTDFGRIKIESLSKRLATGKGALPRVLCKLCQLVLRNVVLPVEKTSAPPQR